MENYATIREELACVIGMKILAPTSGACYLVLRSACANYGGGFSVEEIFDDRHDAQVYVDANDSPDHRLSISPSYKSYAAYERTYMNGCPILSEDDGRE
jgi:hypothetical protein